MKYILIIISLLWSFGLFSQKIKLQGTINTYIDGKSTSPLLGAEIFFRNARIGDVTNEKGEFTISGTVSFPDTLIVRAADYYNDTIPIHHWEDKQLRIVLFPEFVAEEVVIRAKRDNSNILRLDPRHVEQLTQGELKKAACCNLAESFETNATVDVSMSDGVSGSKRIQMMGLSGRYTQLQFENIPFMHNVDQAFGLATVPGTWINSIQITKGTGTIVNGYESMNGLINLEYHKPMDMDPLFVNGYFSIQGRSELNLHGGYKLKNDKWSTGWFIHGSSLFVENDRNKDGFRDMPLGNTIIGMNRWSYVSDHFVGQIGVKVNYTDQQGGQIGFKRYEKNQGLYGVGIRNFNAELFGKTGFIFEDKVHSSLGIIYYAKYDELSTLYGNRTLDAVEKRGYINMVYERILGNTNHNLKTGLSFVYDDLRQKMEDKLPTDTTLRRLDRTELVPGAFAEYTYLGRLSTLVIGVRGDYHNLFGFQFTPRANYKLNITENMDFRVTAGRGFRVSNYAIDNLSLMATNLPWLVETNLRPEISWNFGGSYVWNFKMFDHAATWSADFYHTLFENQLIADRDESFNYIRMRNLNGQSFSNAFQTDFKFAPFHQFTIKLAYKWLEVRSTMGGSLKSEIMVPSHRGFINFEYETRNKKWSYDLTFSIYSQQRLAEVKRPDGSLTTDNMSGVIPMLNAQVTYRFKKFEIYLGGENLLDHRLKNPLIDAENPFSSTFDATRVYTSIFGVNVYGGFRFNLEKKKQ
ncbi:MAG: TonB-dependent receptor plug domain-containing protein [Brumimicrobium sp.]|nr:TonB-dependent receptor plug domain-containing protein [Brumimicrobium sp.]